LKKGGVKVVEHVLDVAKVPEIFNGKIKRLQPKLIGGILALRDKNEHVNELTRLKIESIDLVVCNIYHLKRITGREGDLWAFLANIDIGEPTELELW